MWRTAAVIAIFVWNGIASWYRGVWLDTALVWTFTLILVGAAWWSQRSDRT